MKAVGPSNGVLRFEIVAGEEAAVGTGCRGCARPIGQERPPMVCTLAVGKIRIEATFEKTVSSLSQKSRFVERCELVRTTSL